MTEHRRRLGGYNQRGEPVCTARRAALVLGAVAARASTENG